MGSGKKITSDRSEPGTIIRGKRVNIACSAQDLKSNINMLLRLHVTTAIISVCGRRQGCVCRKSHVRETRATADGRVRPCVGGVHSYAKRTVLTGINHTKRCVFGRDDIFGREPYDGAAALSLTRIGRVVVL